MPKASYKKMNRNDPAPVQVGSSETSGIQPKAKGARLSRPRSAKSKGNKKKPDPEEKTTYTNTMVNDVIDGRGVRTASSSGNVRFRRLVKLFVIKNYCEVIKLNEKKNIAKGIINYIQSLEPPGRFLKSVGLQNYVELDEKECVKKVTQALRDCNRSDRTGYAVRVDVPEDVKILEEKVKKLKSRGRKKLEKVVELLGGHLETMKTQRTVASFTQAQGDEGSSSSNSPNSIPPCKASYPQMQSLQSNQTNLPLSHGGYARTSENKRKRDDFESFTYHRQRQLPYSYHSASPYSRMNYLHPSAPGHHMSELARAPAFHAFNGYGPSPRYAYAGPEQQHSPLRINSMHTDLHRYQIGNQKDSHAQGDDNMDLKYRTKTTAMRKPSTPRSFSQKYEFHPIEHPAAAASLEALDSIPLYYPSTSKESRVHDEGKESLQQDQFCDTIQASSFGHNTTQKSTYFPFDDNEAILGPIDIPQPLKKSSTNETDLSTEVATATSRSSPFTPVALDQNQNADLQLPTTDSFLEDAFNMNMENSRINAGLSDDLLPAEALEISNTEDILGGTDDGLFYFSAQEGENFGKE